MASSDDGQRERSGIVSRKTNETEVRVAVHLNGSGRVAVQTGLGFLDHMLAAFAVHARIDLEVRASGDLEVDDHHTVEDVGLSIGEAMREAIGERRGIRRFGTGFAPLDEALARVVVDISNRPCAFVDLALRREKIGDVATENLTHFFLSLASAARVTLHVDVLRGENDHHKIEAAMKAMALAFREAWSRDGEDRVPSSKGVL